MSVIIIVIVTKMCLVPNILLNINVKIIKITHDDKNLFEVFNAVSLFILSLSISDKNDGALPLLSLIES